MVREDDGSVEVFHDKHTQGLFPRSVWSAAFNRAGFEPPIIRGDPWRSDVFIVRPAAA